MYDANNAVSSILMNPACAFIHTHTLAAGIFYSSSLEPPLK